MTTTVETSKSPHLLMWIAGIAVILFSGTGIAAIMGWIPTSMGRSADISELTAPDKPVAAKHAGAVQTNTTPASHAFTPVSQRAPERVRCSDCGVVESTQELKTKGTGSGVGAVGGAVVGGLLGNQIGNGRGNTVATAIGAVGGAVAGNEVEKRVKSTNAYEVTVRMEDGSSRVVNEGSSSPWHTGDRVKIVSGELRSNQ